jgi:hypothetical protein
VATHVRLWRRNESKKKNYLLECDAEIDMHDLSRAAFEKDI